MGGALHKDQPFVVLRETTLEGWLEQQVELGRLVNASAEKLAAARFYEVSMD
jgi:hypothetical protein